MRKEFRFLLQSARINLALVAGYAAVLTLGAILFPAPEGERNLFYNYFISAPITVSFILFIMSFSMGANNLNISLTLGGRRRDYFWALQPVLALYVGTSWAHPAADVGGAQGAPVDRSLGVGSLTAGRLAPVGVPPGVLDSPGLWDPLRSADGRVQGMEGDRGCSGRNGDDGSPDFPDGDGGGAQDPSVGRSSLYPGGRSGSGPGGQRVLPVA